MSESVSNGELHGRTVTFDAGTTRVRSEPTPSWAFVDADGRELRLSVVARPEAELDGLVEMYDDVDPRHRAQGLPPSDREGIRGWLTGLPGIHLVAVHDDRVVGHAALVPDGEGGHELVIFVHGSYHDAGIGTMTLRTLLAHAATTGVETVWLTVERYNHAAIALYGKLGFETEERVNATLEMRLDLVER